MYLFKKRAFFTSLLMLVLVFSLFSDSPMKWVKKGWAQKGIASWYGGKFQGRLTANGEYFDTYKLTAAHKSLPFNTVVRVKNIDNGKTVDVRVNDRGPFVKNRIIDLSFAAAKKIDMTKSGTARVVIQVIKPGDNATYHHLHKKGVATQKSSSSIKTAVTMPSVIQNEAANGKENSTSVWVQVGAFSLEKNGKETKNKLIQKGIEAELIKGSDVYRVGVVTTSKEAQNILNNLNAVGYEGVVVKSLPKGEKL